MSLPKISKLCHKICSGSARKLSTKFSVYKQLSEPNTCGFGRMSAMNTDMSHEYFFTKFIAKLGQFLRGDSMKLTPLPPEMVLHMPTLLALQVTK